MEEFLRTEMIIGSDNIEKLKNSHVAVFGLGGVGSYVAEALARVGVGTLTVVDNDVVSLSNINRQLYALHSTVGEKKVNVAKCRINDINPECNVIAIDAFYCAENSKEIFSTDFDFVVDAIDSVPSKLLLIENCFKSGIPIICGMGTGNKLNPRLFEVSDIYKTEMCPLCRVMRRELKKLNIPSLKVVYSKEKPVKCSSFTDDKAGKSTVASISFVPSVAGLILAEQAVKHLLKIMS